MVGETLLEDGRASAEGHVSVLGELAALLADFDPCFPIMPGTGARVATFADTPFSGVLGAVIPERISAPAPSRGRDNPL